MMRMKKFKNVMAILANDGVWWCYSHDDHPDWGVHRYEDTHWFNYMFKR
jgi:hypothetical protein